MYMISRYEDLMTIVRDPTTFSVGHAWNRTFAPQHFEEFKRILIRDGGGYFPDAIMTDPPTHTRVRKLMQAAFTPHRIRQLEPAIRRLTGEFIESLAVRGEADGVSDFAVPLTVVIMCEQVGLNHADAHRISRWVEAFGAVRGDLTHERLLEETAHFCDLQNYVLDRVRERQAERREDMISDLVYARSADGEGAALNMDEIVSLARAMIVGGLDTIASALSSLLLMIATDARIAADFEASVEDESRLGRFIEELLRIEPPARGLFRMTTREVALGGTIIPANAMLCLLFASANDDDAVFDHPRRFDMDRKHLARHLTFGGGIHMCIGMHLARMEIRVAAQEIARRLKDIRLAIPRQEVRFAPSLATLGPASLPLTFSRR
jgi:cytochrome P450